MVEILVPSSSVELTPDIQQALLVAKKSGFAIDEIRLGISPTLEFKVCLSDKQIIVGSDLIGAMDAQCDFFLHYITANKTVNTPSHRCSVLLGMTKGERSFDIWYHPLNGEVRALTFCNQPFEQEQEWRHLTWVVTLLALQFPIEDCLCLARAMMNVSRETWPSNYALFPTPVIQDRHLGIELNWMGLKTLDTFPFLDKGELGIYPVVDRVDWIERLLKLGVKTIQLRIKDTLQADLEHQVQQAIELGRQYDAHVFINDYWRLAIQYGAFGVHLGQEDIESANLALIQQAGICLGLSTHGYYELLRICQVKPSYIALGHIYPTTTKVMPTEPQGLVRLALYQRLIESIPYHRQFGYPTVAIGGIDLNRAPYVWECGVSSLAVVRAITQASQPEQVLLGFKNIMQQKQQTSTLVKGVHNAT